MDAISKEDHSIKMCIFVWLLLNQCHEFTIRLGKVGLHSVTDTTLLLRDLPLWSFTYKKKDKGKGKSEEKGKEGGGEKKGEEGAF